MRTITPFRFHIPHIMLPFFYLWKEFDEIRGQSKGFQQKQVQNFVWVTDYKQLVAHLKYEYLPNLVSQRGLFKTSGKRYREVPMPYQDTAMRYSLISNGIAVMYRFGQSILVFDANVWTRISAVCFTLMNSTVHLTID